jgi:hypothetical protein
MREDEERHARERALSSPAVRDVVRATTRDDRADSLGSLVEDLGADAREPEARVVPARRVAAEVPFEEGLAPLPQRPGRAVMRSRDESVQ